jgi:8-oxo-dGTP pyrophosphatase MutT (NUDIX family)
MEGKAGRRRGVVAVTSRGGRLLIIRRSRFVIAPRAYCFPGGGIHAGETETTALIRELREELGAQIRPLRRLWRSVTPWDVPLSWWQVALPANAVLSPDPREVESVHWMQPHELDALPGLLESNRDFLAAWQRGEFELDVGGRV